MPGPTVAENAVAEDGSQRGPAGVMSQRLPLSGALVPKRACPLGTNAGCGACTQKAGCPFATPLTCPDSGCFPGLPERTQARPLLL